MGDSKTITIPYSEYLSLKEDENWRLAMEGAGVDNWGGYDYAMELLNETDDLD